MNKGKKDFVLDCCNSMSSRLKPYESKRDVYLVSYFAMKKYRPNSKSKKELEKEKLQKKKLAPIYQVPRVTDMHHSKSSKSLPPIDSKRSQMQPLSKDEFQALIQKYRADSKINQ